MDIETRLSRLGMCAKKWVTDSKRNLFLDLVDQFIGQILRPPLKKENSVIIDPAQVLHTFLQFGRQAQVAGMAIREERVAAHGWHRDTLGDGTQ